MECKLAGSSLVPTLFVALMIWRFERDLGTKAVFTSTTNVKENQRQREKLATNWRWKCTLAAEDELRLCQC